MADNNFFETQDDFSDPENDTYEMLEDDVSDINSQISHETSASSSLPSQSNKKKE